MRNLSLEEVKKYFEHKNYFIRGDFIDEYDFEDDYIDYYKNFIFSFNYNKKSFNYVSDIIDLAAYFELFDEDLYIKYKGMLSGSFHFVIKLSIINYIEHRFSVVSDFSLEAFFLQMLNRKNHVLVKNQILVSLFFLTKKEQYFNLLLLSLNKTDDWRSIYRTLNHFVHYPIEKEPLRILLDNIRNKHSEKNFGKGVTDLLLQLEHTLMTREVH
ncbi:MAG: hypothetical protein JNL70_02090 [Saprospiraceae bacterium]|nr:hypothetical protein [Saprospiraceae bacterium]